jgi:hypothetical protein
MRRLTLRLLFVCFLIAASAHAADPPAEGEVALTVTADREQPSGWPIVVELRLTNTGKEPIGWWCGGPDVYPPAEHFAVQVRYDAEDAWNDVVPTNGQYVQGSGSMSQLKPGGSITVPLAVPVKKKDGISVRIQARDWHTAKPAEAYVQVRTEPEYADRRRARVIEAALAQTPPFWRHLAEQYPDAVVIDAMLKSVTVDNALIVAGAARVLARQDTLPESAGDDFAVLVQRWLPRSPLPQWGGLRENVVEAALKTRSEAARQAVVDALRNAPEPTSRWIAINALGLSSGDDEWLRRARSAIVAAQQALPADVELARQTKLATGWLDARLKDPNRRSSRSRYIGVAPQLFGTVLLIVIIAALYIRWSRVRWMQRHA